MSDAHGGGGGGAHGGAAVAEHAPAHGGGGHGEHKSLEEIANTGTVTDMVSHFKDYHAKDFDDRIKKFEEFNNPAYKLGQIFTQHAADIFLGDDAKEIRGAYTEGKMELYKHAHGNLDSVNEEAVIKVLDRFVTTSLEQILGGKGKLDDAIKVAKDMGYDDEAIREMKGNMLAQYAPQNRRINLLSKSVIKNLAGKSATDIKNSLETYANLMKEGYSEHLIGEAVDDLLKPTDLIHLAGYTAKKFKEKGHAHPNPAMDIPTLSTDLAYLVAGKDIKDRGYLPADHVARMKAGGGHGDAHGDAHAPAHH